jgi:hypothetical protein
LSGNQSRENRSTVGGDEQGDKLSVRFNIQNSILLTIPLLPRIIAASTQWNEKRKFSSGLNQIKQFTVPCGSAVPALRERGRVPAA